ncbi:3'(2'),5'-bisphosphate nucleotidase CysQ family protein [Arenicella xantha]|uniref:3'(2'), 5'-bisphosphate nucleotidase/myo-inositol-1(Or 4)-monophosphatase n=1 Tax=Arenicella xantha TaxID=644221 RepID=A0A395JIH9_9GAMM|nr:inositol monophosphatase family protein [Arenicella xantha]RBP49940.1 3'(2'), 5'-bisphosphate nucleotidase/myo-inositol-1(or 4)-monophosphatase [Arenicella xantha]
MNSSLSPKQLQTLCGVAIQAAQEAGEWIEKVDRDTLQRNYKDAGNSKASQIVTEVDVQSENLIRQRLDEISEPAGIPFIGEESSSLASADAQKRFNTPYFWCVDPLDGTLPFSEGRAGYAVSISLVAQSGQALIGVVYDPAHRVLYHAVVGQGCYRNSAPFSRATTPAHSLQVYADASFKAHQRYELAVTALQRCARDLGMDGVTFSYGSGAVKNACQVLESSQSCYLKLPKKQDGGGSIWDYAATTCLAQEAGAWVSNINGKALALNRRDSTFMNHEGVLFASNSQIANLLLDSLWS